MEIIAKPDWMFAVSPALLDRGCVNIIGLEQIKLAAGVRWEKARSSICAHLESMLRRTLGPSDFFAEVGDTAFLVSTPAASREESQVCCLRVAHDLHTQQLGRCDMGDIRIARASHFDGNRLECAALGEASLLSLAVKAGLPIAAVSSACAAARPRTDRQDLALNRYIPLWDVGREAITTYRCVTAEDPATLDTASPQVKLKASIGALLARIAAGTNCLADHLDKGERFLLSLPIPYELWSSPAARMEVTAFCRNLSSELRPYMFFEISDLPDGVPQSRLSELVGSLRPFCRGVAAELPPHLPSYSTYQGSGLHAVSLSLSPGDVWAMRRDIAKLSVIARSLRVKSVVYDVHGIEMLRAARDQGVTAISGSCVGAPLQEPAPISRLRLGDMAAALGQLPVDHLVAA